MKNENNEEIITAFFAEPPSYMEFWKLTRGEGYEISSQRYSSEFTSRVYFNRRNSAMSRI